MALTVRKGSNEVLYALVSSFNAWRATEAVKGSYFHADVTSTTGGDYTEKTATAYTVNSVNATTLPTSIALANELKLKYNTHVADTLAHKVADSTDAIATAAATDLATTQTLLNAIKAAYNLHRASTTYHYTADSTNSVATADATDQASANALANALKTAFNAHIAGAPGGSSISLVAP